MNSKRAVLVDGGGGTKRSKDYSWKGYLIKTNEEAQFVNARLYDDIPSLSNQDPMKR